MKIRSWNNGSGPRISVEMGGYERVLDVEGATQLRDLLALELAKVAVPRDPPAPHAGSPVTAGAAAAGEAAVWMAAFGAEMASLFRRDQRKGASSDIKVMAHEAADVAAGAVKALRALADELGLVVAPRGEQG